MNKDIEQAIQNLRNSGSRYAKTERYYAGNHDLAFATEKFENAFGSLFREFALNLCPAICDAVRDKLRVTGFSVESAGSAGALACNAGSSGVPAPGVSQVDQPSRSPASRRTLAGEGACVPGTARSIWHRNRMGAVAGEIHKEALKNGDAFAIVWPNARGEATIYPNKAANCTVAYDDETPGRILWAAKCWRTADKFVRLNLFYPDRIEKYISKETGEGTLPEAKGFVPLGTRAPSPVSRERALSSRGATDVTPEEPAWQAGAPAFQSNPYGIVPVFHFANNADIGTFGQSELAAAIPIQDGLNKSVLDMLVAMEFSAFRQRWAAGIEVEYKEDGTPKEPFTAGVDHLWITESKDARFGDFDSAALEQFLKVKDSFRMDMASVTGTPLHYFLQNTAGFRSGESLKKAETRFLAKVRDRQESLGQVWADLMAFALRIEGAGAGIRLITEWGDPAPMSQREVLENILLKKQIGLPVEQALIEAGYGAADAKRMVAKRQEG